MGVLRQIELEPILSNQHNSICISNVLHYIHDVGWPVRRETVMSHASQSDVQSSNP